MVETTTPPSTTAITTTSGALTTALSSALANTFPTAHQRAQSRITTLQAQRASEASLHPHAIFNRNLAGPGVVGAIETRPSFRVGQLDTELLDEELLDLLKQQLWGGLKYFSPSLKETYEPELLAILRATLFKLTIWDNDATYGAALQNLRYVDARRGTHMSGIDRPPSKSQKILYGLVTVGGRYIHSRVSLWLLSRNGTVDDTPLTERLSRVLEYLSTLHSFAAFFSFLLFLKNGHYRTLLDRALRLRLVAPNRVVSRDVSFEYLNRQLVWHAFTEFLLFILPLVKIGRWRRWYNRFTRRIRTLSLSPSSYNSSGGDPTTTTSILKRQGELSFLPEKTCAICYKDTNAPPDSSGNTNTLLAGSTSTDITNPYEALPCGHLYCYICITSKISLEEGEGWECLRCQTLIKKCRPWKGSLGGAPGASGQGQLGDWGEENTEGRPMSSAGKKVGFNDNRRGRGRSPPPPTLPLDDGVKEYYYHDEPEPEAEVEAEASKFTELVSPPQSPTSPTSPADSPEHNLDGSYTYIPEEDQSHSDSESHSESNSGSDSQDTERPEGGNAYQIMPWDGPSDGEGEGHEEEEEEEEEDMEGEEEKESVYDTAGEDDDGPVLGRRV